MWSINSISKKYCTAMHHVNCQAHGTPCHDWAKSIHACVLPHNPNFGIAERIGVAGHVKFDNCTLAYYIANTSPKVQTCTNTIALPCNMLPLCLFIAPPCPFKPIQCKNTQLEHFIVTVGRCSCAGTSEGNKAIKPLRKASTFSHGWHGSLIAPNWSAGRESS